MVALNLPVNGYRSEKFDLFSTHSVVIEEYIPLRVVVSPDLYHNILKNFRTQATSTIMAATQISPIGFLIFRIKV